MSKKKKNRNENNKCTTEYIVLITALLKLIESLTGLVRKLIE